MQLSINAWLDSCIQGYTHKVQDAVVDFFMAEAALSRENGGLDELASFHEASMALVRLARWHGDDRSCLQALKKLHNRLLCELANKQRPYQFRVRCLKYARGTLKDICALYACYDVVSKAKVFRSDFVRRAVL